VSSLRNRETELGPAFASNCAFRYSSVRLSSMDETSTSVQLPETGSKTATLNAWISLGIPHSRVLNLVPRDTGTPLYSSQSSASSASVPQAAASIAIIALRSSWLAESHEFVGAAAKTPLTPELVPAYTGKAVVHLYLRYELCI